jgi:hypothetical protein
VRKYLKSIDYRFLVIIAAQIQIDRKNRPNDAKSIVLDASNTIANSSKSVMIPIS